MTENVSKFSQILESIYRKYNSRKYVHPDPLEFLYDYSELEDREIVGLIASSLAYGRVLQILKSVNSVLEKLRPFPRQYLEKTTIATMKNDFRGFRHRFTSGEEMATLLYGIKKVLENFGSLGECMKLGYNRSDDDLAPALANFTANLFYATGREKNSLLPRPELGSACKRLNLYLRWMVRHDEVDPGGWIEIPPSKLIFPLDVHMLRAGQAFGFTKRKQADLKTAREITAEFRKICPDDPVKYDFGITRLGIRNDISLEEFTMKIHQVD
jgi:uncharacterized protein (TIGR02757 family)